MSSPGTANPLVDVQILFYAIDPTADLHAVAVRWLEDAINGREPVGLAWPTVHQYLRLGTNPAFPGCMNDEEAVGWIEEWLEAGVELVSDADVAGELLSELAVASPRTLRNSIDDAHLAAIAISNDATLASFDSDFETFVAHGLRRDRLGSTWPRAISRPRSVARRPLQPIVERRPPDQLPAGVSIS